MFNSIGSFQSMRRKYSTRLIIFFPCKKNGSNVTNSDYFGSATISNGTLTNTNNVLFVNLAPGNGKFSDTDDCCIQLYNNASKNISLKMTPSLSQITICFFAKLTTPVAGSKGFITFFNTNTSTSYLSLGATFSSSLATNYTIYVKTNTGLTPVTLAFTGNPSINLNNWCHFTFTMTPSSLNFYINGSNLPYTGANNFFMSSSVTQYTIITASSNSGAAGYDGYLCDLRLYDRILDQTEISELSTNTYSNNIYIP